MKYIIAILVLFSPIFVLADNCSTSSGEETIEEQLNIDTEVPAYLKGAKIIVRLADGKESVAPIEKYKVVPRKQQFITTKTKQSSVTTCQSKADKEKNRISLLGGQGPQGTISTSREPGKATIEADVGAVGGLQYQRLLNDRWSVGGQLQTNDTGLLNLGYDF